MLLAGRRRFVLTSVLRYFLCVLTVIVLLLRHSACECFAQTTSARALTGDELVRIGEIHDAQNHYPEALTYYGQALDAFQAQKQRKREAIVLTKIASVFERQGRRQAAAVQLRRALALFPKTSDSPVHADALYASGRILLWMGSREEAAIRFNEAMQRYRRAHNEPALGAVMLQSGLLKVSDASSEEGLREIHEVLDAARARRDDEQTLAALVALGDANWILDRIQAATAHYEQGLALLAQRPRASIEAGVRTRLAALLGAAGRDQEGIAFAKRAITLCQSLRDKSGEAASWALLGLLDEAQGKRSEAEEALHNSLALYRQQTVIVHAMGPAPGPVTAPVESRSPTLP
jgi:tetratricopeptide (TPR) repeat protein